MPSTIMHDHLKIYSQNYDKTIFLRRNITPPFVFSVLMKIQKNGTRRTENWTRTPAADIFSINNPRPHMNGGHISERVSHFFPFRFSLLQLWSARHVETTSPTLTGSKAARNKNEIQHRISNDKRVILYVQLCCTVRVVVVDVFNRGPLFACKYDQV